MNDKKSRNIGEILTGREDSCSPRNRCKSFLSFLLLFTARCKRRTNERVVRHTVGDSQVLESIIYMDRNGTCLSSILILGGVAGQRRGRRAIVWTIPYISRGRFMEIRPSRYNDRWYRYDRDRGTCVLRLSATFFDSHAEASRRATMRPPGHWPCLLLNMEESREIAIRRVRSGFKGSERGNFVVM